MNKVHFVTTNHFKFKKFTECVEVEGVTFSQLSEETPEIQGDNNSEVAEFSARWMAEKFNRAVIKEDVGIYIHAWNGFPGPYTKQSEKWLKGEGFLKLMQGIADRSAHWEYAVAYCEPGMDPVSFYVQDEGNITEAERGEGGNFVDKIFVQDGQEKTISQLLDEDVYVRKTDHYEHLQEFLRKRYKL